MDEVSVERDAVRLLCLLYFCGECKQMHLLFEDDDDYTHCIESEGRLQKLDFWLRYPDHFAAALLRCCEPGNSLSARADEIKQIIRQIFAAQEPDLRWIPMQRYLRGAYQSLEVVMQFLTSRWLVYRRIDRRGPRTSYFLTTKGYQAVERLVQECPQVAWYLERCKLINTFFGDLEGVSMRKMQYLEPVYEQTPMRRTIERVDDLVRERFLRHFGEPL